MQQLSGDISNRSRFSARSSASTASLISPHSGGHGTAVSKMSATPFGMPLRSSWISLDTTTFLRPNPRFYPTSRRIQSHVRKARIRSLVRRPARFGRVRNPSSRTVSTLTAAETQVFPKAHSGNSSHTSGCGLICTRTTAHSPLPPTLPERRRRLATPTGSRQRISASDVSGQCSGRLAGHSLSRRNPRTRWAASRWQPSTSRKATRGMERSPEIGADRIRNRGFLGTKVTTGRSSSGQLSNSSVMTSRSYSMPSQLNAAGSEQIS